VVIRRHRLRRITLDDLVGLGTMTDVAASFLSAAVKARKSIVVAGAQGAGKTTLVRALCAEIPPHEAIGTFETEYELHLHELRDQHPIVFAWEARPGSGERGPDGPRRGSSPCQQALFDSFRFNLSRQIVGEVRGHEILAMLKAMESGAGSISTTHAPTAEGAIAKLVTCAMEAGPHVTHDYAVRAIAAAIDVVVHVHLETTPTTDGVWQRQPVGRRDHHRRPRGEGQGVRDPARVPHRTRRAGRDPARPGRLLPGPDPVRVRPRRLLRRHPRARVMTPCCPPSPGPWSSPA
jgi:pilus assembly protein CpaF